MKNYKCTNCGHITDTPIKRGNGWIEFILWLCYIIPGLLYSIWRRNGEPSACPSCKKDSLIPVTPINTRKETACKWCAETILASACVCKHCGRDVIPLLDSEPIANQATNSIQPPKKQNKTALKLFMAFVVIAIIGNIIGNYEDASTPLAVAPSVSHNKLKHSKPISKAKVLVSDAFICRAAVAEQFGRSIEIMKSKTVANKQYITYVRPDDGITWGIYCWVSGNRILWQTDGRNNTGSNGNLGRVRDGEYDEVITYSAAPDKLTIKTKYSDGSTKSQVFKIPKDT